jgi:uncharacterized protein Yka (UPF0111/DUF47 family)
MFKERDNKFFSMLEQAAQNVVTSAEKLLNITADLTDKEKKVAELKNLEHYGDELTHDIIAELHKAFITPIDREDIFLIAKEIDTIVDQIETAAQRFIMFDIQTCTPTAKQMAELILAASKELITVMRELRKPKQLTTNNRTIVEINRLENEGDKIYRETVKDLYSGSHEPLTVVKWREIYDHFESTLDALEDVANVVEGVAMKHA